MNEIVKYHNYINSLKFTGFTVTDFNFLIMLCSRMRDKDVNRVTFNFMELRELTNYKKSNSVNQFVTDLKKMNEKLMNVTCSLETESEVIMFVLFPTFIINKNEQTLTVSVNEKFKFILNELIKNFTRFDLKEFVTLESKYSKSLYRLLKQYRTTGKYEITVNDLKTKMDCPKSYNNKQFMQNIINPAVNSLQNCVHAGAGPAQTIMKTAAKFQYISFPVSSTVSIVYWKYRSQYTTKHVIKPGDPEPAKL